MTRTGYLTPVVLSLILLLPLAGAHGGTGIASDESVQDLETLWTSNRTALPNSLDVHATEVVFASSMDNGSAVGIWVADTTSDTEQLMSKIRTPTANLTIDSLAYDGTYIAWADDRSGSLDVYVIDTRDRSFRALTESQSDQRQVNLDEGTVVWSSWGDFTIRAVDLDDGKAFSVGTGGSVGPASAPDIHEDTVVWSKSLGGANFEILLRNLETGNVLQLTDDPLIQTTPQIWGDHVVWAEGHLPGSIGEVVDPNGTDKPKGTRIMGQSLLTGETRELSPGYGSYKRPATAGVWAAWHAGGGLALYDLRDGHLGLFPAPANATTDIAMSQDLLAFAVRGQEGIRVFADHPANIAGGQPSTAGDGDTSLSTMVIGGTGLALLLGAVGIETWRRRSGVT